MRIDRSRLRVVRVLDAGHDGARIYGLLLRFGTHEFEAWPNSAYTESVMLAWADVGATDRDEVLGWIEEQFLVEELSKLSAHQRIAMIRDGLLLPELSHPGT